jgi:hypothetical protein
MAVFEGAEVVVVIVDRTSRAGDQDVGAGFGEVSGDRVSDAAGSRLAQHLGARESKLTCSLPSFVR